MTDISIFDLPPLHKKPSASTLLHAINSLAVDLPSFEGPSESSNHRAGRDATQYLTFIVSSPLAWLPDDEAQDAVWTAASRSLSERAGRSARPSRTRTLEIPSSDASDQSLQIHLHEPTITSDLLGHKTWVAGYLLAKRLPSLSADVPLVQRNASTNSPLVLELGSGTGLVGLALAHRVPSAELHLTDLPTIVSNLAANVERNFPLTSGRSSLASKPRSAPIHVFTIDWNALPSSPEPPVCERTKSSVDNARLAAYDLIIAADVLYGKGHPPLVARAAAHFLKRDEQARVVVEVPIRERAGGLVDMLKEEMNGRGLQLRNDGEEEGWEEMGSEEGRVRCWWAVWEWREGER